ncbi:MAG: hypothetical protein QW757_00320 [Candidatus Woesearchaeota archaeon]
MAEQEVAKKNYDSLFSDELFGYLERIEELEKNFQKIDKEIDIRTIVWANNKNETKIKLNKIKEDINFLKTNIENLKKTFMSIVFELKFSSNKEDFDLLNKKIENFDYLNFITRKDFIELVKKELNN